MASFGKPSRRGSLVRISQVLLGVFVLTTCGQDTATGPGGQVNGFIDATALLRAGGQVPIPVTEVFVELRHTSDSSVAFSRLLTGNEINQNATSLSVQIRVDLRQSPEDFYLVLQARGGGVTYYEVRSIVTATSGAPTTTQPFTPQYVGPGASGVDSVVLAISNPYTPAGGTTVATATVYANNAVLPGVPVGFISSDPTKVPTPVNNGLSQAVILAPPTGDDSVVITAVTPVLPAVSDTATFHYVPVAARIVAVSGDAQSGLIGTVFALPLIVEVQDAGGAPYRGGYPVTFGVASGPGGTSVAPTTITTDLTGQAQTVVTAGNSAGALSVTARATGLTGSPLTFNGTATIGGPGIPTAVAVAGGNNQSAVVNTVLGTDPSVLVTDAGGVPVSGVAVAFAVTAGGGSITGANATTNGSGVASLGSWKLGQTAGANTLSATVAGITPVSFTATGTADVAAALAKVSGDNQTDSLNKALTNPLVVLVSDQFGNPVSGVTVTWAPSDGNLSATTSTTNTNGQASVNWTLGLGQANPTVTATVSGLTPVVFQATTLFPGPQILISQAGVPGVGIGLTATIDVGLSGPAGPGGVAVALASSQTGIFTVTPSTLNIPQGASAGTATITGVSSGIATLTGTATGYIAGSLPVDVQNRNISIPTALNVPYGQSGVSLPIQIPAPAPAGGVTFAVSSSAPTLVGVSTPTVTIPAGGQTANALLNGLLPGPSTVTVSNAAYVTATSTVTTAAALDLQQTSATLNLSFGAQVDINFTSNNQGIAAPAPGVPVAAVITDPTCLKAVTTPITIPTGIVSAPMALVYGGTASLPCTTQLKVTAGNIQPDSINVTVNPQPGITLNAATVGSGLQISVSGQLGASNHGGATVTLISGNSNLLLSRNATTPGSASITVTVPVFQQSFSYYIQAKEGLTGTTPITVTAQAPGFINGTINYNLVQGAIDLIGVPSSTTTLSASSAIYARTGIPDNQTTPSFLTQLQAVRAGAPGNLIVTFQDADPNGASTLLLKGPVTQDTLNAQVPVGGTNTPTDTTSGGVAILPQGPGTSTISAVAPGFLQVPSAAASPVTIAQPGITLNSGSVGSGLQISASGSLGAPNHGGVGVTLTSGNAALLFSPNATTPGTSSITVNVPNGQTAFSYYVQGLEGQTGTRPVTITASATGFADGTTTFNLMEGAIDLIGVPANTTTLSPISSMYARTGIPNSTTTPQFLTQLQNVRAGAPGPVTVVFQDNDPNGATTLVAKGPNTQDTLTAQVPVLGSNTPTDTTSGGVALLPQAAGTSTISAVATGFLQVTTAAGSAVTVAQPTISINAVTVGSGLQVNSNGSLAAPAPTANFQVTLVSPNPNLLLAPNATTAGTGSITLTLAQGATSFSFYVQGKEGLTGTTSVTVTGSAAGFANGTADMSLVQGAIDLIGVPASTTTLSPISNIYARTGIPNSQTTPSFLTQLQNVRFGAPGALTVNFLSTSAAVADLLKAGPSASGSQSATIPIGSSNTPTDTTSGGVAIRPLLSGTTTIRASITGFLQVTNAAGSPVSIAQPGITVNGTTVGSGLQVNASGSLGAPNHGGVTVRLISSNGALLLAPDANTPGTSFIDIVVPNGTQSFGFYLQGLEGQPDTVTAAITATASGFTTGNGTADVVPAGFDVIGLPTSPTAGGPDVAFYVRTGVANQTYSSLTQLQNVRAGAPAPLDVTVGTDAVAIGPLVTSTGTAATVPLLIPVLSSNTPTSVATGGVAFRPAAAGAVTITTTIPGLIGTTSAITLITVQ